MSTYIYSIYNIYNVGEQFHVMRDGPFHHTTVLAGLWGGDNYANFSRAREVRARLLGVEVNQWKFYDQKILKTRVWPAVRWVGSPESVDQSFK